MINFFGINFDSRNYSHLFFSIYTIEYEQYNIVDVIFMDEMTHTINLLLMEDESTTSVVDFFKKENNVNVHLFDNLNDVHDALNLCSNCPKDSYAFYSVI